MGGAQVILELLDLVLPLPARGGGVKESRVLIPLESKPQGESLSPVGKFFSEGGLEGADGAGPKGELGGSKGMTFFKEVEGIDEDAKTSLTLVRGAGPLCPSTTLATAIFDAATKSAASGDSGVEVQAAVTRAENLG